MRRTDLHTAAEQWNIAWAEKLLKDGADINARDEFGNTPLNKAVFASRGRGELITLLLAHGADPLAANHSGVTPVGLARTIANFNVSQYFVGIPDGPAKPPPMKRPRLGIGNEIEVPKGEIKWKQNIQRLFEDLTPVSGQAQTVQGELLRAVMKLTDEAYRNGNGNWDRGFKILAAFVGDTMGKGNTFTEPDREKIREAAARIVENQRSPDLSGDGSDYYFLSECAVRWCFANPKLIPHEINPKLKR